MTRNHRNRPEGNPSEGVGFPNTFITPARNRILSFALAVCLLLTMTLVVPGPIEVYAISNGGVGDANDGINFDDLIGSGIYFGTYKHRLSSSSTETNPTPVLWRGMGEDDGSGNLTLLSEYVLDTSVFNLSSNQVNIYEDSSIQKFLADSFLDDFSDAEKNVDTMVPVDVFTHEFTWGTETPDTNSPDYSSTANSQPVYLPWGTTYQSGGTWQENVFWTAGSDIQDEYALYRNATGDNRDYNKVYYKGGSSSVTYWLRSPRSDYYNYALFVTADGSVYGGYVNSSHGVRPAFQLNPSSVLFTSEIKSTPIEDWETEADGTDYAAGGGRDNYKLTVVDTSLTQPTITGYTSGSSIVTVAPGGNINLTNSANTEHLVYKIVEDTGSGRKIVGYGTGDASSITVDGVANVTGTGALSTTGDYTLYVWAQKDGGINSHEGSEPVWFKLEVATASNDATLEYVAGKPITTTGGTGATTTDPLVAEISLGHSTTSISDADLVAAGGATAEQYDDDTYANPQSPITLDPDVPTHLYIKVTAQDGTTMRYYRITATIQPAGASTPPSVSTNTLTVTVGETADFTVNPGEGADAADHASISSSDTTIATATPTSLSLSLGQSGTVTVEGKSVGNATISIGYSGGSRNGGSDTVQVTVTDPANHSGSGSTRSSGGSSGVSSTPDSRAAKTPLPASAFAWDGRTLTIGHDSVTPLGLLSVRWDGATLTRGTDYGVYQGSVIVRFGEDFMAAQAPGNHTVRVEFLNHTGETTVTVDGEPAQTAEPNDDLFTGDTHNPNTGGYPDGGMGITDNPNTGDGRRIWLALLLGGMGAAALVIFPRWEQQTKMRRD